MKMETVIRSPQRGVVAKLVHKAGVSCSYCDMRNCRNVKGVPGYLQSRHRACSIRRGH